MHSINRESILKQMRGGGIPEVAFNPQSLVEKTSHNIESLIATELCVECIVTDNQSATTSELYTLSDF